MKIDFNYLLNYYDITNKYDDNLTIDYTTGAGRGKFTVKLTETMPTTAHNMKIYLDMIRLANNPENTARALYDYLTKCANFLTEYKNKLENDTDAGKKDRAQVANQIKRYTANIDALCKVYKFDAVKDPDAVKMTKTNVVTVAYDREKGRKTVENKPGYRFEKAGRVFHVYKTNKTNYIICPECGGACVTFYGDIKAAPEYITEKLLENLKKVDMNALNRDFMELLKGAENIVLNDDIKPAPDAIQENNEPATDAKPAPDPDIRNAINIIDNDIKYTVIAAPWGRYDIVATNTDNYMIAITIDNTGKIQRYNNGRRAYCDEKYYNNDNVKRLYAIYEKLQTTGLLPEYTPNKTTAENTKQIYNRHAETKKATPPYYIYTAYYMQPAPQPHNRRATKPKKAPYIKAGMNVYTPPKKTLNKPQTLLNGYITDAPRNLATDALITAAALILTRPRHAEKQAACNTPGYYNTS